MKAFRTAVCQRHRDRERESVRTRKQRPHTADWESRTKLSRASTSSTFSYLTSLRVTVTCKQSAHCNAERPKWLKQPNERLTHFVRSDALRLLSISFNLRWCTSASLSISCSLFVAGRWTAQSCFVVLHRVCLAVVVVVVVAAAEAAAPAAGLRTRNVGGPSFRLQFARRVALSLHALYQQIIKIKNLIKNKVKKFLHIFVRVKRIVVQFSAIQSAIHNANSLLSFMPYE